MEPSHATQTINRTDRKTILIVEDDEAIREALINIIQSFTAYQVVVASNGVRALTMLRSLSVDLLLLDYQLPDMTGIQFYDLIHTVKALEQLPTLLMSSYPLFREARVRHLPFVQKPFDINTLLTKLDHLLS